MKLSQLSPAARLYAAFALVLLVTITLAVCAVVRVNSIEASLDNAEAFRTARLEPLYEARKALAQTALPRAMPVSSRAPARRLRRLPGAGVQPAAAPDRGRHRILLKDLQAQTGAAVTAAASEASGARYWITALAVLCALLCADIGQVDQAIVRLDEMTLQNAALVEEASARAQSLRLQADQLAGVVNTFQLAREEGQAGRRAPQATVRLAA